MKVSDIIERTICIASFRICKTYTNEATGEKGYTVIFSGMACDMPERFYNLEVLSICPYSADTIDIAT